MAVRSLKFAGEDSNAWRLAAGGLVLAAVIVGFAIMAGGSAARMLNGVGAIVWIVSGIALGFFIPTAERQLPGWIAAAAGGLLLGGLVRPGTVAEAVVAFAIAGAAAVVVAGDKTGAWAFLVPAIYLPVHLIIGIGRAMVRESGVRTDPPPTAAILPLVMILAAGVAGAIVAAALRARR